MWKPRRSAGCRSNLDCLGTVDCAAGRRRHGWESRFGCYTAISLSILEVKRLLLLTLEMLLDSRAIRFAGALVPVVFSFVDVGIGFPVAVATVYAIRNHQARPCQPKVKRKLRRVAFVLAVCAILNIVTVVLIGCQVNLGTDSLRDAFRTSMKLYARQSSYKIAIDELQLDLQCCGFASYTDWFTFDWQGTDYVDSEDREEYGEKSIPFSCCSRRTLLPCIHAEMRREDVKTVNSHGCVVILNRILLKITIVGYTMTSLIMCTQILTIIFLIRIIKKVFPEICPSECSCWEAACPLNTDSGNCSLDECANQRIQTILKPRKICRRSRVARKVCRSSISRCSSSRSLCSTSWSSSDGGQSSSSCAKLTSSPSLAGSPPLRRTESATVVPSAQLQHQVPQNKK